MCGDNFSLGYEEVPVGYANKNGQDSLDQSHLYLRERGRERERERWGGGGVVGEREKERKASFLKYIQRIFKSKVNIFGC